MLKDTINSGKTSGTLNTCCSNKVMEIPSYTIRNDALKTSKANYGVL